VVNFTVRITRELGDGEYRGLVFIGPTAAPTAIEIQITYDSTAQYRLHMPLLLQND